MDLEKLKIEFIKYTNQYDLENENIKRKIDHSFRVMQISKHIAEKIGLTKEKIELAIVIGLLHDIGRFEQYKRYQTFYDADSMDHGDYGVEILTQDKMLRKYIETMEYDNIILKAIKNHNKLKIEENLTKEEEFFSKLIRDADKLDIFYEGVEIFWKDVNEEIVNSRITEEIKESIERKRLVERKKGLKLEGVDVVIGTLVLIYDLNYKQSFQILKENDNINKIIDRFDYQIPETKKEMKKIRKNLNQYIDEKIKQKQ